MSKKDIDLSTVEFDMEKIRVAVNKMVDGKQLRSLIARGQVHQFYDMMVECIVLAFTSYLYGGGKERIDIDVKVFATWWDHTKARWFPKWLLRILPFGWGHVNCEHHQHEHDVFRAVCPHLEGEPAATHARWVGWQISDDEKERLLAEQQIRIRELEDELVRVVSRNV